MKIRSVLLNGILAFVEASPSSVVQSALVRRGSVVTATEFANFHLFAQYAAAAYCSNNDDSSGGLITCASNACPLVQAAKAVSVVEFDNDILTGEEGFVAIDSKNTLIVVSFRGSDSVRNWIDNIFFDFVSTSICSGCEIHDGFSEAWEESKSAVLSAVSSAKAAHPSYSLVMTGHSLGAAVATIAGAYLRKNGFPCAIYTYGSPRVGNAAFANYVTAQSGGTYRITHLDDPVPVLPSLDLGYHHTSPEYWLSDGTSTTVNYAVSDIKICTGISSTSCNAGQSGVSSDFTAHDYYFEYITVCAPDFGS